MVLNNYAHVHCLFQVIPLLSLAILIVGALHLGDCQAQPLLPIWHIVAGSSGLCTPFFYLLFDEINPWLSRRFPTLSELMDNAVVLLLPVYIIFEVSWLVTGTFWVASTPGIQDPAQCNHTVYIFSYVVVVNFWWVNRLENWKVHSFELGTLVYRRTGKDRYAIILAGG